MEDVKPKLDEEMQEMLDSLGSGAEEDATKLYEAMKVNNCHIFHECSLNNRRGSFARSKVVVAKIQFSRNNQAERTHELCGGRVLKTGTPEHPKTPEHHGTPLRHPKKQMKANRKQS